MVDRLGKKPNGCVEKVLNKNGMTLLYIPASLKPWIQCIASNDIGRYSLPQVLCYCICK